MGVLQFVFVLLLASSQQTLALEEATAAEKKLMKYVEEQGGLFHFKIGRECETCIRGVVAAKDMKEGDIVVAIPLTLAIWLDQDPPYLVQIAHDLVTKMHTDPNFNKTYSLFWDTMPTAEETWTEESFTDEQINMLHTPFLETRIRALDSVANDVYYGTYKWHKYENLENVVGAENISLDKLKYVASLIRSRDFSFSFEDANKDPFETDSEGNSPSGSSSKKNTDADSDTETASHEDKESRGGRALLETQNKEADDDELAASIKEKEKESAPAVPAEGRGAGKDHGEEEKSKKVNFEFEDGARILVPVADMINHSNEPNVWRWDNATHLIMFARNDIKAGETLWFNYHWNIYHRTDLSLVSYGFIEHHDPPLLLATDLPDFSSDEIFKETNADDSFYYGPEGIYNSWEEYFRMRNLLEELPTTEEEDKALLAAGQYENWREKTLIEFRMYRKAALRLAMEAIRTELENESEL